MKLINNMKIVSSILSKELPNYKFDKLEILLFSSAGNRKIFFIGERDDNEKTLFKHSDKDECYYDIMDRNRIYYEDEEKSYLVGNETACTNLKSIDEYVKEYKKKRGNL